MARPGWHGLCYGSGRIVGAQVTEGASAMPGPLDVAAELWRHLIDPFYDAGPNDKGIGIQLAYSMGGVLLGYGMAVTVAIPLGFLIGMSPLVSRALDPFIQIMKPISPLAWMPLALYTIRDSNASAVFVIFICAVWPMLVNTALSRRQDRADDQRSGCADRGGGAQHAASGA